jgi:hypothetical protein
MLRVASAATFGFVLAHPKERAETKIRLKYDVFM